MKRIGSELGKQNWAKRAFAVFASFTMTAILSVRTWRMLPRNRVKSERRIRTLPSQVGVSEMKPSRFILSLSLHVLGGLFIAGALGFSSQSTALAAGMTYAYVANNSSNSVSVIDAQSLKLVTTIAVGSLPTELAASPDGQNVLVTNQLGDTVSLISVSSLQVINTLVVGATPVGVDFTPDGRFAYVTVAGDNAVAIIDMSSFSLVGTVSVGDAPVRVKITPDGSLAYVSNQNSDFISIINTSTNTVVNTIVVGSGPYGLKFSPDGTTAYVAIVYRNAVGIINTATQTLTTTVSVGSNPTDVAITSDGAAVYVNNQYSNTVSIINTSTEAVMATVPVGASPTGISITPDQTAVWVSDNQSNQESTIDTATNMVTAIVPVGKNPVGVILATVPTFTTLHSFDGTDGTDSLAGLVQAANGYLYGTTSGGGSATVVGGAGTVFKITPSGTLTTLYTFCSLANCADGVNPWAGLVQATNGYLYGTTAGGGNTSGTVFRMTPSGTLTTLYDFCSQGPAKCTDGVIPNSLVQAANGNLYGTTMGTANPNGTGLGGTVFEITPEGTLTTLYRFCSQTGCTDGNSPTGGLFQASDGSLYGTTQWGGASASVGTIFKITPGGTLTTLYRFCSQGVFPDCPDGGRPEGGVIQAAGGLYGTTYDGGANDFGTVFKIAPGGTLTTLYSFCSQGGVLCTDGGAPGAGLIQATDGNLYGITTYGGDLNATCTANIGGCGTVFRITPSGTFTTLYRFCSQGAPCTDGGYPEAGLVQATNGDLYGTTSGGLGTVAGNGTVFSLSLGLGPFVKTLPAAGVVGEGVRILGYELTGATSVTFNGIAAVFTVVSSTEITTTVPTGATTGSVQVVTPSGTLASNVSFVVAP
jgi:YVTN family beta-propeller protein/uncharacterized repeat protein (TIGR03803 family)